MNMLRNLAAGIALCAAGLLASTCLPPPDGCVPTATRCNGQRAEICDGATRWSLVMDCTEVGAQSGGSWVCCDVTPDAGAVTDAGVSQEHICLPANQCAGGAS